MLNPSGNGSAKRSSRQIFQELIHNRPLALGGLWVSMLLVGSVAALGLFSAGEVERENADPSPSTIMVEVSPNPLPARARVRKSPQTVPSSVEEFQTAQGVFTRVPESSPQLVPLWLFGAIALTCATGSLLIYLGASGPKRRRKPRQRRANAGLRAARTASNRTPRQPAKRKRRPVPTPISLPPALRKSVATEPVVTVLSADESHPLDWGNDSLVDTMDLRKQHSLSSLLSDR